MRWPFRRLTLCAVLFALVGAPHLALADETPSVPMFRGDAARTGEMPGPGPKGDLAVRWQVTTDTATNTFSSPVIVDSVLYTGNDDGLLALDAATGDEFWRLPGIAITSMLAVADGLVYAGSAEGVFLAVDARTGEERWRLAPTTEGDTAFTPPVVLDGIVYVGYKTVPSGTGGALHALDAATGAEIWRTKISDPSGPAAASDTVYVSNDDTLHALNAATGEERWRFKVNDHALTSPAVGDGIVYIGSRDKFLYAVDAETGRRRWRYATGGEVASSPAVASGTVFAGSADGHLYAVDAARGRERWQFSSRAETFLFPVVADGAVYACGNLFEGSLSEGSVLYALDASSGLAQWWHESARECLPSVTVIDGMIYLPYRGPDGTTLTAFWTPPAS